MNIESKLILTSQNAVTGVNLYTFVLTYPRVILAEVNTHRALSRNTASSRAIPSKNQRERVLHNPFVPISIGANKRGMQAGEELKGWRRRLCIKTWEWSRYLMVGSSWILDKAGAHKQIVNRLIEPWTWTQQIVTCTDIKNVLKLRNHPDAEPHFHELARQMAAQVDQANWILGRMKLGHSWIVYYDIGVGKVQILQPGQWHLPFIDDVDMNQSTDDLKKTSTARCARVSYFLPETGESSNFKRDLELCNRLSGSGHWSPFEHVATPVADDIYIGNFRSWKQYRKEFSEEAGGDR